MMPHMKGLIEVLLLNQTENSNFILKNIYEGASANFCPISAIFHVFLVLETYMTPHMKGLIEIHLFRLSEISNIVFKNIYKGAKVFLAIFWPLLIIEL